MSVDNLVAIVPSLVAVLYFSVAVCYFLKGDLAWCLVWASYALANVGLILIGMRG